MINLLPPPVKEEIGYAKLNAWILKYLKLVVVVAIILAGAFGTTYFYLQHRITNIKSQIASKQEQIGQYASLEAKAKQADSRLTAIQTISAQKTHFSTLLSDLAKVTPQGVSIQSLTLTGDATKPVLVSFSATNYQIAVAFRDALVTSPRIAAADIQSISAAAQGGGYTAAIDIGFKPGEAQ
jgi:Tfp pilus assembly protein PilN